MRKLASLNAVVFKGNDGCMDTTDISFHECSMETANFGEAERLKLLALPRKELFVWYIVNYCIIEPSESIMLMQLTSVQTSWVSSYV